MLQAVPSHTAPPWTGCALTSVRRVSQLLATTTAPTTDATFRYRSLDWGTSCGTTCSYEYVVAQQPSGGGTARDALSATEAPLPRPPSGWSLVLIPSVSLVCSGKEEMRPLATALSQHGHRCYILEWPGWSTDHQTNWALTYCKVEDLSGEYQDFWCQLLDRITQDEADEAQKSGTTPKLCIVGAGHAAVYAMRALHLLGSWAPPGGTARRSAAHSSLVLLAPTWQTLRYGLLARLPAGRAARLLASWLHSDSRLGRLAQSLHFSGRRFRRHFVHWGTPEAARLAAVAAWLFQRPRPYAPTDGAALCGLLDPPLDARGVPALAEELSECAAALGHGVLLLQPAAAAESSAGMEHPWEVLGRALHECGAPVESSRVPSGSPLPHEAATSAVVWALDQWLSRT